MRREYLEDMRADGFGDFIVACEELKNCKFIIAESKITAVLKAIADNKQLYSMFGAALSGFDYRANFTACVDNGAFALPSDPKTAIALVFRILLDIDGGKMSLRSFLEAYFFSESLNESYVRFGLELIAPFETYCRMFISQSDPVAEEMPEPAAQPFDDPGDKYISDLKTDALACVAALSEQADTAITGVIDRAEYKACLNGLLYSLKEQDTDRMIAAFLGVKYAVAYFFRSDPTAEQIYKKLEYDIKHITD